MYEIRVLPVEKHKKCKCEKPCGFMVQFVDIAGYVEKTMCLNAAKSFAFAIIEKIVQANNDIYQVRKDRNTDKRWRPDEERMLKSYRERGLTYGQIGIKLGRTSKAVKEKLHRMESMANE